MKETVTLREYLRACRILGEDMDISVDFIADGCIAYCGEELTPEGEEHFKEALDLPMEEGTVISSDNDDYDCDRIEDGSSRLALAWEMLCSMAGFCSVENYDKWFIESER